MLQNAYYTANYVRWAKKFAVGYGGRKILEFTHFLTVNVHLTPINKG